MKSLFKNLTRIAIHTLRVDRVKMDWDPSAVGKRSRVVCTIKNDALVLAVARTPAAALLRLTLVRMRIGDGVAGAYACLPSSVAVGPLKARR